MTDGKNNTDKKREKRFGIDHATGELILGSWRIPLPRSRIARMAIGLLLIICGLLGFLPILGFWMLPLGFIVLSHDLPIARRWRRRLSLWWHRRGRPAGN
ncbi:hypothetical protein [Rhizobium sp. BG4]|uniref:hypothetical protein n=1 Tax=Rhizobium sp. BG4 TaxID=2613770 RepID=UPI00193E7624|nr:hypothetical protein [Rhizobium sp. BG4]QRM45553.1 hypothetical protein F2982_00930 [Rhizobium sp. BG4]